MSYNPFVTRPNQPRRPPGVHAEKPFVPPRTPAAAPTRPSPKPNKQPGYKKNTGQYVHTSVKNPDGTRDTKAVLKSKLKPEHLAAAMRNPLNRPKPTAAKPVAKPVVPKQPAFSAPWLAGFAGSEDWMATYNGGWYNPTTGQVWKSGDPIPGSGATGSSGSTEDSIYQALIAAFAGL